MRNPFAYGFLRFMVYVHQDGRKFYVTLGRTDVALGLTATTRPILWARYPGRGSARQARRWFKDHAARHGLNFVFDR
jgi:hypothetical protein